MTVSSDFGSPRLTEQVIAFRLHKDCRKILLLRRNPDKPDYEKEFFSVLPAWNDAVIRPVGRSVHHLMQE